MSRSRSCIYISVVVVGRLAGYVRSFITSVMKIITRCALALGGYWSLPGPPRDRRFASTPIQCIIRNCRLTDFAERQPPALPSADGCVHHGGTWLMTIENKASDAGLAMAEMVPP